eukprot:1150346-Pelagomonas_calceolata.AAC.5
MQKPKGPSKRPPVPSRMACASRSPQCIGKMSNWIPVRAHSPGSPAISAIKTSVLYLPWDNPYQKFGGRCPPVLVAGQPGSIMRPEQAGSLKGCAKNGWQFALAPGDVPAHT